MKLTDKVVVVTGGARGIGRALARRFAGEKPAALVIADRELAAAEEAAAEAGGVAASCDVGSEAEIQALVKRVMDAHGRIDLFCSNAGVGTGRGIDAPDADWQRLWNVNTMAHVWATRALLPAMERPGGCYLVITASAAGLLCMIGDAAYTVTKHAAVGLAEWLAITYGDRGLRVSCLCPMFVNTDMLREAVAAAGGDTIAKLGRIIEPDEVADATVAAIEAERFLILPHQEVGAFYAHKAADLDRWLAAMRKLQAAAARVA
jgi:NAD(P)-dependent dehydrogenase (short-subunit alcohol dehydrogenase family)